MVLTFFCLSHSLSERCLKRSPLQDVASLIYSIHYAATITLTSHVFSHPEKTAFLEPWLDVWYVYVSGSFLKGYLHTMKNSRMFPKDKKELEIMLRCFLIHRVVHELGREL
jgi:maltose alpha-D-glucosyltransferase/alpha-amylase